MILKLLILSPRYNSARDKLIVLNQSDKFKITISSPQMKNIENGRQE